ncbi:MAG: TQO small subunit DoxD, partial [Candidatus Limnocylindrus sp.]
ILRIFLGGTMLYAGLDKLILDPRFLQTDGVGSIGETLRFFVTAGGPLAPLVEAVALSQPVAVGAAMAIAQLVVAGSLLTGSWVRSVSPIEPTPSVWRKRGSRISLSRPA